MNRRRLSFDGLGLHSLQYRGRPAPPGSVYRQCDRSQHERHGRPRGGFGQNAGRAARAERRLAALASKSRRDIAALSTLQQNYNDDEETNQDVDGRNQVNHDFEIS